MVGDFAVDGLQELLELDRAVTRVQASDHLARGEVQRRVEARGAGAPIVVAGALGDARQQRQDRRGAIERLDLGLLIDAQHDGALGRVEIEPDDVVDLVDELRVLGELEGLSAMGLQPERPPDPQHRVLGQTDLARHRTRRPVRRVFGRALQRADDHLLDLLVGDRARAPRPRFVEQPIEPMLGEPIAPLGDHRTARGEPLGDLAVRQAIGGQQHDPRALRERLRGRAPPRPRLKLGALLSGQIDPDSNRRRHPPTIPLLPPN